jgi:hypothetical protein
VRREVRVVPVVLGGARSGCCRGRGWVTPRAGAGSGARREVPVVPLVLMVLMVRGPLVGWRRPGAESREPAGSPAPAGQRRGWWRSSKARVEVSPSAAIPSHQLCG